jgi:hypothetical protein
MRIEVLDERGYESALLGVSLSYKQDPDRMPEVARRLAHKGGGHNKFLESIVLWLDVTAPRYWWQQFDTYRIGVTKQSESTMHTMTKRPLTQGDFEHPVPVAQLAHLNKLIAEKEWKQVKWLLPESFLQRRIVCLNYMALQRMIRQRATHKLEEWQAFIDQILGQIAYPEFLKEN